MNDLKEFFKKREEEYGDIVWTNFFMDSNYAMENPTKMTPDSQIIERDSLGLFFWKRGGEKFVQEDFSELDNVARNDWNKRLKIIIVEAKECFVTITKDGVINETSPIKDNDYLLEARDFLDALDCLGKEKIKELIKKVKH